MHTEYMVHTIYICKILSSLTFSLQSCIWLKSLKVEQRMVGNGTPQPLHFVSFSLRSLLFFLPTLVFDGVYFSPNTPSIWTPVRSCCSRMWSGSEAHKLMNITFYLLNCRPKSFFGKSIQEGGWCMIHVHNAQHREGRSGQVETGHPNPVGAAAWNSLEMTKAVFEADRRFPVPSSTEGSEQQSPIFLE